MRDEDPREAAPLPEQFDRLRSLPPGWLETSTPALDRQELGEFQLFLEHVVKQAGRARPFLYPTEDGGARAEWSLGDWEIAVTADLTTCTADVHATNVRADEAKDLRVSFNRSRGVEQAVQFLRQFPGGRR